MNTISNILIVEDAADDYEACVTALTHDHRLSIPIVRCETGDDALNYLGGKGAYSTDPPDLPSLILLDLNLPGTDGREVLSQVKADSKLKMIPVVVMTSSRDQSDIDACYRQGANSYVVKPINLSGFLEAIARLRDYWFQIVLLPAAK